MTEDKAQCCLLVICGIPASGKSSLARSIQQYASIPVTIVSFDDFLLQSPESDPEQKFSPGDWKVTIFTTSMRFILPKEYHKILHSSLRMQQSRQAAFKAIADNLTRTPTLNDGHNSTHHLVIADDTMHYRSMRKECYQLARQCNSAYLQVYIDCPVNDALSRNASHRTPPSTDHVPPEIIEKMAALFEDPRSTNAVCDRGTIILHTDCRETYEMEQLWMTIWDTWKSAVPRSSTHGESEDEEGERKKVARRDTSLSVLHQVDVQTRRVLSNVLQSASTRLSNSEKKEIAYELNAHRHKMISMLHSGDTLGESLGDEFDVHRAVQYHVQHFARHCDTVVQNG